MQKVFNGVPARDLKELYQISQSTIRRLVSRREIKNPEQSDKTTIRVRALNNRSIWKMIALFIENAKEPFYWKDIKAHLIQTHGTLLNITIIRRILKEKLGLSFKRCSPRPLSINGKILKLKKILF